MATGDTTQVERTATEQYEQTSGMGVVRLRVRWLDDCTYQLFDRELIDGTEAFPTSQADTVTIHIVSSDDKGFFYEGHATFVDGLIKGCQFYNP